MVTKDEHHGRVHVEEEAVHLMAVRKQKDLGKNKKKTSLSNHSSHGHFLQLVLIFQFQPPSQLASLAGDCPLTHEPAGGP